MFVKSSVSSTSRYIRAMSSEVPKTGIVMQNMGGPASLDKVESFLVNLFSDKMIINLGRMQSLGAWAARKRTPKIVAQYAAIGGGSPIGKWTALQGREMCRKLDKQSPNSGPHQAYTAFRYVEPDSEAALRSMAADGVKRAVAFSQYPMYSCTTTGSSLTHLWAEARRLGLQDAFEWSVIDRWYNHPTFIKAMAATVLKGLDNLEPAARERAVILFSAHSLPLKVVEQADPYPNEVNHSVELVMAELRKQGVQNSYQLCWQSKVGFLPWLAPATSKTLERIHRQTDAIVMVPIAFTSDHIETLFEMDVEYKELAHSVGIKHFSRAPALNDEPLVSDALAQIVQEHLASGAQPSPQYKLKCLNCINPDCRTILEKTQQ